MASVTFIAYGWPVPQGSKRGFRQGNKVVLVDVNDAELQPWRQAVGHAARTAWPRVGPSVAPFRMKIAFSFTRPKGHYGAQGKLLPSAPKEKSTKPDLDKLVRAILDGLTGIIFRDDSQVYQIDATKGWGDTPGAVIKVEWDE